MNLGFYFCLIVSYISCAKLQELSKNVTEALKAGTQNSSLETLNATFSTPLNATSFNSTHGPSIFENTDMLYRGFYVFLGVTTLVVIYFGIKTYR